MHVFLYSRSNIIINHIVWIINCWLTRIKLKIIIISTTFSLLLRAHDINVIAEQTNKSRVKAKWKVAHACYYLGVQNGGGFYKLYRVSWVIHLSINMVTLTWVRGMNALNIPDEHIVGIWKEVMVKQRVHIWSSLSVDSQTESQVDRIIRTMTHC